MIINSKKKGADGSPFTHVNLEVDSIKAIMSITKYQTAANILYASLLSFFQSSDDNVQQQQPAGGGGGGGPTTTSVTQSTDDANGNNNNSSSLGPTLRHSLTVARDLSRRTKRKLRGKKRAGKVNRLIEINLKHLDLTLVSDYVEELELFFVYLKVTHLKTLRSHKWKNNDKIIRMWMPNWDSMGTRWLISRLTCDSKLL